MSFFGSHSMLRDIMDIHDHIARNPVECSPEEEKAAFKKWIITQNIFRDDTLSITKMLSDIVKEEINKGGYPETEIPMLSTRVLKGNFIPDLPGYIWPLEKMTDNEKAILDRTRFYETIEQEVNRKTEELFNQIVEKEEGSMWLLTWKHDRSRVITQFRAEGPADLRCHKAYLPIEALALEEAYNSASFSPSPR